MKIMKDMKIQKSKEYSLFSYENMTPGNPFGYAFIHIVFLLKILRSKKKGSPYSRDWRDSRELVLGWGLHPRSDLCGE